MHIKSLTIQGFKSYRDSTSTTSHPFSPHHNVIVGRNGSGKSNFFSAIRFVLSDAYEKLSREERSGLLHEGMGRSVIMSAFVEIVFDNSDHRFPTALPTLTLRRTIGLKKDEYTLDKKSATKAEVMNLLESAGFSRSNPYYIVPQGRITAITNQKESERLDLLKEIAGTSVYENKRQESVKIMEETEQKRTKIVDLLEKIEERLSELEEEKADLKDFQEKDKDRRCLEYTIYARELTDLGDTIGVIEDEHKRDVDSNNQAREAFDQRELQIKNLEKEQTQHKNRLSTLNLQSTQIAADLADQVKKRTELECTIEDIEQASEDSEEKRREREEELQEVEERIAEVRAELEGLEPSLEEKSEQERELRAQVDTAQGKLDALYAKQGRTNQFRTKAERDTYLRGEINTAQELVASQDGRIATLAEQIEAADGELEDARRRKRDVERDLEANRAGVGEKVEERDAVKAEMDDLTERRKTLLREDGKLSHDLATSKEEKQNAERFLNSMMDKDTRTGLEAIDRIRKQYRMDGVYGPLYELFEVDERYKTAVEVTAGTSLFQVVVDTDETVTQVLNQMKRDGIRGRVTFMPLNRLKTPQVNMPNEDDAIPMLSKLQYDRKYQLAFEQVFGRTVVCAELNICTAYTRSHGVSAITLDGDRVDRKGALTGGYHDLRRSRLDAIKSLKAAREKFDAETARHAEVQAGIVQIEQQISVGLGRIQVLDAQRKALINERQPLQAKVSWIQKEEEQAQERRGRLEKSRVDAEREQATTTAKVEAMNLELRSAFSQTLSNAEIQAMTDLNAQLTAQQQELAGVSKERLNLENQKRLLDIELNEDLLRRQNDLQEVEKRGPTQAGDADATREQLRVLQDAIDELQQQIDAIEAEIETLNQRTTNNATQLDQLQTEQLDNSRGILKAQKSAERYIAKRQMLFTRKEECNKTIRDLGVLPAEAYTKYTRDKSEKLVKLLHKVQEHLKGYSHVNKKAFEQYQTFTKDRDALLTRRDELDASGDSIQELIETLDARKDEAIERTFKQVSKNFAEIFEKLVPAGRGKLRMLKRLEGDRLESQSQAARATGIDSYTGVAIEVSFNSKVDEGLQIQQLSGGQKSLVALAIVFAIQKCDPAPFYLFDEIDANLDAQYRTAVAAMIQELSREAQFLCTTFRGELIEKANQFYGVIHENKVSRLVNIDRQAAEGFVEASA